MAILYGVGVGVGDIENITLRAVRVLNECEVIALPAKSADKCQAYARVKKIISDIEKKEIICLDFPMTRDEKILRRAHDMAAEKIRSCLKNGKNTAFITIGDPSVYSTFSYVYKKIKEDGYECQLVSGVTSFCAAAAACGTVLVEGDERLCVVPYSGGRSDETKASCGETYVYMKSGKNLSELMEKLKNENPKEVFAAANLGMENEIVCRSIEEMEQKLREEYMTVVAVKG